MLNPIRVAAVSLGLLTFAAVPASAFTITFDEAGHCSGCTGFEYTTDPSGTYGGNVLIYDLPAIVGAGPVNIFDVTGSVSDTLYFFANVDSTHSTQMIFYSYDNGGLLADVGLTSLFPDAFAGPTENQDETFTYGGGSGSTYNGLSGSITPIPAALPLFATGLGSLGLLGWRRKKKARALAV